MTCYKYITCVTYSFSSKYIQKNHIGVEKSRLKIIQNGSLKTNYPVSSLPSESEFSETSLSLR